MKLNARKMIVLIMIILVFVAVCTAAAFALLIHETKVDSSVVFGEIKADAADFVLSADKTLNFTAARQIIPVGLTVRNNSDKPFNYRYEITVTAGSGLEKAILVSYMGDFVGTLGAGSLELDGGILYPRRGTVSDGISETLEFELHNGAEKSYSDGRNCAVNVRLIAETVDYGANIFVTDGVTLKKAIDDVNGGAITKTVHVLGDVAAEADLIVENAVTFDFSKGNLNFNGHKMIFNGARAADGGIVRFQSPRGANAAAAYSYKPIVVGSAKIAVDIDENCRDIGALIELNAFNERAAAGLLEKRARGLLSGGIASGESADLFGALKIYSGRLTLERGGAGETGFILSGGGLDTLFVERTIAEKLNIRGTDGTLLGSVAFNVVGRSASAYEKQIADAFKHLYALTAESGAELNADIYLPTSVPRYNMSIAWSSDRPDILDDSGAISADGEGNVELTAHIEINGEVLIKTLTFNVFKQNNQMRFDYLVARIGEQRLTALYTADSVAGDGSSFTLPTVNAGSADDYRVMYGMRNIGLDSLSYQLDVNADFLSLFGGNTVALMQPTFETSTDVTVRGIFKNEPKKIYEASVHVVIEPIDDVRLHEEIVEYVQGILNNIDILNNILSTRAEHGMARERGDFILPGAYKIYTLKYSLSDAAGNGADDVISAITETTDAGGGPAYSFAVNASRFDEKGRKVRFFINIEMTNKNDSSIPATSSPLYVNSPGAVHFGGDNALGIDSLDKGGVSANSNVFYNLKLQVLHALKGEAGVPTVGGVFDAELKAAIAPNYILARDLGYLRSLYLLCDSSAAYGAQTDVIKSVGGYPCLGLPAQAFTTGGALNAENYGILSKPANIEEHYIAAVSGGESLYGVGDAESVLDYFAASYKSLKKLTMTDSGLKRASVIGEVGGIEYIDLSDNAELNAFAWLSSLQNAAVKYIDVSGTNFSASDAGLFDALYYRCSRADNTITPEYYYTGSDGARTRYVPSAGDNLLLSHLLYSLELADTLDTRYLQLKETLFDGGASYAVAWSIRGAIDGKLTVGGADIAAIIPAPQRLENLLSAAGGTAEQAEIELVAALTKGSVTVERVFRIKLVAI